MDNAIGNCNGKIWIFLNGDVECLVNDQDNEQISCYFILNEHQKNFTMTFIYTKCKVYLRRHLWVKCSCRLMFRADPGAQWDYILL